MSKRIKERIQIGEDANGKPIYEWIDGYSRQELFVKAAEVLQRYGSSIFLASERMLPSGSSGSSGSSAILQG